MKAPYETDFVNLTGADLTRVDLEAAKKSQIKQESF